MTSHDMPHTKARTMPPTKPPATSLEAEIADTFVRIENNYVRETTNYGSRFEGECLEVVQARWAIRRVRNSALAEMAAEVREVNIAKGWRSADGSTTNTFGDYIALMHSELSEALEAYRDHRLEDATGPTHPFANDGAGCCQVCEEPDHSGPFKPEGVGSEMADVLIRLLDTCDIFGINLAAEFERKLAFNRTRPYQHGGRTLSEGVIKGE